MAAVVAAAMATMNELTTGQNGGNWWWQGLHPWCAVLQAQNAHELESHDLKGYAAVSSVRSPKKVSMLCSPSTRCRKPLVHATAAASVIAVAATTTTFQYLGDLHRFLESSAGHGECPPATTDIVDHVTNLCAARDRSAQFGSSSKTAAMQEMLQRKFEGRLRA
jgi:hypothetical protein